MFIRPTLLDAASGPDGARHTVRDPDTMAPLANAGEEKPDSEYWLRRELDGGVERCDPPESNLGPVVHADPGAALAKPRLPALFPGEAPAAEPAPTEEPRP